MYFCVFYQNLLDMKRTLLIAFFTVLNVIAFAQYSTKGFGFQGYAVDSDGKALAGKSINVRFTIARTPAGGTNYVAIHTLNTDAYGVFGATIGTGNGTETGTPFAELNFASYDYILQVEVKKAGAVTYTEISNKVLDAVPFARSAANGVPVGTILPFAGANTKVPDGWLLCNGASYSETGIYSQLASVIGTTWGTGSSDFAVPDLRGVFLRGANNMGSGGARTGTYADPTSARAVGSFQDHDIQSHNHTGTANSAGDHTHSHGSDGALEGFDNNNAGFISLTDRNSASRVVGDLNGAHTHSLSINNTGGAETRPVNAAVNYIIKY